MLASDPLEKHIVRITQRYIIDNYCSRCMVFTVPTMLGSCGTVLMHNKFFGNRSLDDDTSDKEADMEATA